MIIDAYFKFKQDTIKKSKYYLIAENGEYNKLQFAGNNQQKIVYLYTVNPKINSVLKKGPGLSLSAKKYVSGLYFTDNNHINHFYGDIYGSDDGFFGILDNNLEYFEIFIVKGSKNLINLYFQQFNNDCFTDHVESVRSSAIELNSLINV